MTTEIRFATAQDVADRWRTLTSDEVKVANMLASDASDMIRSRWPDVDSRIDSGALRIESLVRVVANMVKRAMLNGEVAGLSAQTQGAGPFNISQTFANPNGTLFFTADEISLLDGEPTLRSAVRWLA